MWFTLIVFFRRVLSLLSFYLYLTITSEDFLKSDLFTFVSPPIKYYFSCFLNLVEFLLRLPIHRITESTPRTHTRFAINPAENKPPNCLEMAQIFDLCGFGYFLGNEIICCQLFFPRPILIDSCTYTMVSISKHRTW